MKVKTIMVLLMVLELAGMQLENAVHHYTHSVELAQAISLNHTQCADELPPVHSHTNNIEQDAHCFWCTLSFGSPVSIYNIEKTSPVRSLNHRFLSQVDFHFTHALLLQLHARAPPQNS